MSIVIQAVVSGAGNNGIVDSTPIVLVNQVAYVASVVASSTTSGGADPETLLAYLNRLSNELQLLTPRPILPADFAALASNVAGVYRAVAINGLNGSLTGQERCCTVAAVDIDGNALSSGVESALSAYLEAMREVNFLVPVIGPTYSEIDITFSAVSIASQNPATVEAAAVAALQSYLSPANWGTETVIVNGTTTEDSDQILNVSLPSGGAVAGVASGMPISGYGIPVGTLITGVAGNALTISQAATVTGTSPLTVSLLGTWDPTATVVRYLELVGVVAAVPGIAYVSTLTFAVHGNTLASTDITLTGYAPLTTVGTISGVVTGA